LQLRAQFSPRPWRIEGMKRTPLPARKTPMPRGKGLKPRSKKTAAKYVERRKLVARLLEERPECEAGRLLRLIRPLHECWGASDHIHEVIPRGRGGDILDESICVAVCPPCHDAIHTLNREEGEETGLLRSCPPRAKHG
jgi:hypothetical protein